jgi:hypothetical protein
LTAKKCCDHSTGCTSWTRIGRGLSGDVGPEATGRQVEALHQATFFQTVLLAGSAYGSRQGANVMITIFGDSFSIFCRFLAIFSIFRRFCHFVAIFFLIFGDFCNFLGEKVGIFN